MCCLIPSRQTPCYREPRELRACNYLSLFRSVSSVITQSFLLVPGIGLLLVTWEQPVRFLCNYLKSRVISVPFYLLVRQHFLKRHVPSDLAQQSENIENSSNL